MSLKSLCSQCGIQEIGWQFAQDCFIFAGRTIIPWAKHWADRQSFLFLGERRIQCTSYTLLRQCLHFLPEGTEKRHEAECEAEEAVVVAVEHQRGVVGRAARDLLLLHRPVR